MVFYFVYKASKECKNRGFIPRRLETQGCTRVCRSFWQADDDKVNEVLRVIGDNQPILLKRLREVRKTKFDDEGRLVDIGSLVVIAYNAEKDEKGKIRRLMIRAPYIRLRRAVYAFCQDHSKYDKRDELIDASHLFPLIREVDKDAKIFSRIAVMNADSINMLQERANYRVEREVDEIIKHCKKVLETAAKSKVDKRRLDEEEKRLCRRFLLIKKISNFYEKWLNTDSTRTVMRIYPMTRKLRSVQR